MYRITKIPSFAAALLVTLLPAGGYALGSPEPGVGFNNKQTFFQTLVDQVAQEGELERNDFALIAVNELVAAYRTSYRQSADERPGTAKAELKLARWRRELSAFIDQLDTLLEGISYQSRIEIERNRSGPFVLFIDRTPVVLSGPEIGKAGLMEQRIIDRFCQLHDCERYRQLPETGTPQIEPRQARGGWHLNNRQGATYETEDGLIFTFHTLDNRAEKQARSELVARDLRLLVAALEQARQAGYPIEWNRFSFGTLHDGVTEHIVINSAGDYLNMDLHFFGNQRNLLPPFLDWAKRRLAGELATLVIDEHLAR